MHSRSSSAHQDNRADDLMSLYSEGFDGHQNASGFTNLDALDNKPINIKFKKQIRDRLTKNNNQESELQKQVNKLDGGDYGEKKKFVGGHYGGHPIPVEIKKKTKGNFDDEMRHPEKKDNVFFAEEGDQSRR